jgi:hypothetical protein
MTKTKTAPIRNTPTESTSKKRKYVMSNFLPASVTRQPLTLDTLLFKSERAACKVFLPANTAAFELLQLMRKKRLNKRQIETLQKAGYKVVASFNSIKPILRTETHHLQYNRISRNYEGWLIAHETTEQEPPASSTIRKRKKDEVLQLLLQLPTEKSHT